MPLAEAFRRSPGRRGQPGSALRWLASKPREASLGGASGRIGRTEITIWCHVCLMGRASRHARQQYERGGRPRSWQFDSALLEPARTSRSRRRGLLLRSVLCATGVEGCRLHPTRSRRRGYPSQRLGFLLELLDALPERLHDLRQLAGAKDHHDDDENDDELLPAKPKHAQSSCQSRTNIPGIARTPQSIGLCPGRGKRGQLRYESKEAAGQWPIRT